MTYTDNRRIAKNTFYLYGRMIVTMVVSLFTSRIVLESLGVTDFGVYNVVGGFVAMLGFFNSSVSVSTQRFLNVGMSTINEDGLKKIFSTAINAHVLIGLITVVLLETIGLWFVNNKLVIPADQMINANWVFQCSVLAFFVTMVSVPYNSAIIAHEKMSAFAWMSIVEVVAKLIIAYALVITISNRLRIYAIMLLILSLLMRFLYNQYCIRHFPECRYIFIWDKPLLKKMFTFSGWMIFGCITDLLNGQGLSILINIFFGPMYNASRAVAMQVQSAIAQFSTNFIVSVNPQITKSYAAGEYKDCYNLVFLASKMSFFLLMIFVVPVILHSESILKYWLGIIPPESSIFVILILLNYMVRSLYGPIAQINQAYGKVKVYQLSISLLYLINFALVYLFYRLGYPAFSAFLISIVISVLGLFARLIVLEKQVKFPLFEYCVKVISPTILTLILSIVICWFCSNLTSSPLVNIVLTCFISLVVNAVLIWFIGLSKTEKHNLNNIVLAKIPLLNKLR